MIKRSWVISTGHLDEPDMRGYSRELLASRDFAVLAAQAWELESFLRLAARVTEDRVRAQIIYRLRLPRPRGDDGPLLAGVAASVPRAGRVEAALAASSLLEITGSPLLILIGTAGGFPDSGVALGDLVVATSIVDYEEQRLGAEHEFRLKYFPADEQLLAASKAAAAATWDRPARAGLHFGTVLSGDKVVASPQAYRALLQRVPAALGVEMEGAGAATAALCTDPVARFLMIRGIVDLANEDKRRDAELWLDVTCSRLASFTAATLNQLHADRPLHPPI